LGRRETARPDKPTGLDHGPSNSSIQPSTLSTASRKKKITPHDRLIDPELLVIISLVRPAMSYIMPA